MQKIKLSLTNEESIARILLDDGKGNVLDSLMMEELQSVFDSFKVMPKLKLIVIEGEGKHFSFGASVAEHKKDFAAAMLNSFHHLFFTLRDLAIPTLAKISGQCLGGGMELAIMCNFLFCDKTAKFGQPEIILGVFPPPASVILPLKIGAARAEELLITGRTFSGEEAKLIGLVNELVEDKPSLDLAVNAWIEKSILPKSASSLRFAVAASRVRFNQVLTEFLPKLEEIYVNQLMVTMDANEGINSFLEKRTAVWTNN